MTKLQKPLKDSKNLVAFYGVEGGVNNSCTNNCNCGGGGDVATYVVGIIGVVGTIVGTTVVAADADPSTPHELDC